MGAEALPAVRAEDDAPRRPVGAAPAEPAGAGPDGALAVAREALGRMRRAVRALDPVEHAGRVIQLVGPAVEALGPALPPGELCALQPRGGGPAVLAETVGFRGERVLLMPLEETVGIGPGARVVALGRRLEVPCGPAMLGRVLDGLGRPADGGSPWPVAEWRPVEAPAPDPLERRPIQEPLPVGVRVVDGLLTCGRGQRLGIFAGSGVGKSTLLGMIVRGTAADVTVVALIGERGRELREFLDVDLGPEGLRRSVVVAATSDRPALARIKAGLVATAVAEHFRDQGADVLLVMDSLTRLAMAQREVGLASGEPPATRGYTPSVFGLLPRLLERAGRTRRGSITAFYTVLVEGDDMADPVADTARSILDGHLVLARELAERGHYPPVDVLQSASRLMGRLCAPEHLAAARDVRAMLAAYRDARDLIQVGAYQRGSDPAVDRALDRRDALEAFLQQGPAEASPWTETVRRLQDLAAPAVGGRGA